MIQEAICYVTRGWRVFPAHGISNGQCTCGNRNCISPGKHPRIRDWPNQATTDEEQIRQWWERWPDANVAIATGQASGIAVLDVDLHNEEELCIHEVIEEDNDLSGTLWATTGGGGEHFYYAIEEEIRSRNRFRPGLDFKAEGGYVIAPPSRHISGEQYEWGIHTDPIPLPTSLHQLLREPRAGTETPRERDANWLDQVLQGVPEGQRNDAATSLAGHFIRLGMRNGEIPSWMLLWNNRNNPPLDAQEIHRTVASVRRTHERNNGGERVEVVSFADILAMPEDTTPPIIANVLYQGESLLITGSTGIGKSLMALELCLSLAIDRPFLDQYEIADPQRVLLIQSEIGLRTFRGRLSRMTHDWSGARAEALRDRLFTPRQNESPQLAGAIADRWGQPTPFMHTLRAMIEEIEPSVVFFDPLSTYHGANSENENADMRRRLDSLSALANEYNLTLVLIHHHSKSPHEGLNKSRGATAITDWASAVLTLTKRNSRREEGRQLIRAKWTKVRSFASPEPLTLEMVEGATFRIVDARLADVSTEDVVGVIEGAGGSITGRGNLVEAIRQRFEVGRDRAERILSDATRAGLVISERDPENGSRRIFTLPEDESQPEAEGIEDLI